MMITAEIGDFGIIIPDKCPTPTVGKCVSEYGSHCPCHSGSTYRDGDLMVECTHKRAGTSPVVIVGQYVYYA